MKEYIVDVAFLFVAFLFAVLLKDFALLGFIIGMRIIDIKHRMK